MFLKTFLEDPGNSKILELPMWSYKNNDLKILARFRSLDIMSADEHFQKLTGERPNIRSNGVRLVVRQTLKPKQFYNDLTGEPIKLGASQSKDIDWTRTHITAKELLLSEKTTAFIKRYQFNPEAMVFIERIPDGYRTHLSSVKTNPEYLLNFG